jgi:hypothetical protein
LAAQAAGRFVSTNTGNGSAFEFKNSTAGAATLGTINFNNNANTYPGQIAYLASDALTFRVAGQPAMSLNTSGLTVNGTFVSSSDRNVKEHFQPVSARETLDKVAALPVSRWNYKADKASEHIGPMAQDFYAAFGVGPDDKHITTIDESGVALAAIQGLNEKVEASSQKLEVRSQELEDRSKQLEAENAALKQKNNSLEQRLEVLEKLMLHQN